MDDFTTLAVQRASLTHDAYRAAAPSTWIFLIGAYRTFYYVRRSVKKFAELSAPGDYAIALVCWDDERLENVKLNKYGWGSAQFNEANVRAAFGGMVWLLIPEVLKIPSMGALITNQDVLQRSHDEIERAKAELAALQVQIEQKKEQLNSP